jgi:23S rRNA (guanosine2251-2'-O)-methyltransferase
MFISGFHSVLSQLKSNLSSVEEIFMQDGRFDNRTKEVLSLLQNSGLQINKIGKDRLTKISKNESHQGIVAKISLNNIKSDNELKHFVKQDLKLILILDNITDPRNIGACMRSANAFNVDCVIIAKDGCGAINETTYKTSAGSINDLTIFQVTNISRTIKLLQQNNFWVLGLDGHTQSEIQQQDFSTPHALVMGSEGKGLRELTKKTCDGLVKIPMLGTVESLNVAVATGISLFTARNNLTK